MSTKARRKDGQLHQIRERIEGGLSVYELTLVAIDETPRTPSELCRIVSDMAGRQVHPGTIARNLRRAIENGTAIWHQGGKYTEPDDALSRLGKGKK